MLIGDYYSLSLAKAKDPNTSSEELEQLAASGFYNVRYWVAQNPNVTVETLEKLSEGDSYHILSAVASSPNVTDKILRKLVLNEDPWGIVPETAAENPNASEITRRLYLMTVTQLS
jgi:hypothetical protein